jgi:hypothetical protein
MSLVLTLAVLVTWLALAIGFCAIGVFWLRRLTGLKPGWQSAYLAVWAGFGLLMAGLLVWHFFLPVNERALWLFALLATASLLLERRWFASTLASGANTWFVLATGAFALWAANHALAAGGMDDYNYEFQAIRWFHDYRIVPGLANLHGRIGFNNSHHLFAAMLSSGPWSGTVNHVFNGLFTVLAFTLLWAAVRDVASGRTSCSALLGALLLSPCVGLVLFGIFGPMMSTLKADIFICAATTVLAILFVEFAETSAQEAQRVRRAPPNGPGTGPRRSPFCASSLEERFLALGATILLLAAVLFSVKITAVVFCGFIAAAVVIRLLATVGWGRPRVIVFTILIPALIVCSVLLRGLILSGYPLYPSTILGANVDWRVPVAQATAERAFITSWAQLRPTYDPALVTGWAWILAWARSTVLTDKFNIVLPLMLALLCMPWLTFRSRGMQQSSVPAWGWATLATASILSLFVWFVQAPAGRFAFIYFWIVFAVILTAAESPLSRPGPLALALGTGIIVSATAYILFFAVGIPGEFRSGMVLMLVFGVLWIAAFSWAIRKRKARLIAALCLALGFFQIGDRAFANVVRLRFALIGPMVWLQVGTLPEHREKPQYVPRKTRQGVIVYEAREARYDTPLPNTRFFNPSLELRSPGNLGGGFRNPQHQDPAHYGYSVRVVDTPGSKDRERISPE